MLLAALTGFVIGFIGSMPIAGPIAALVFGRGLEDRGRSALFLALGSAVAESIYAYLAFWGFSAFLSQYTWITPVSSGLGAVLLTGLGLRFALKRKVSDDEKLPPPDPRVGNKRSFFLGFTVTILNPTLIATWTTAVTLIYPWQIFSFEARSALPFSVGAAFGIVTWFATLVRLLNRFRTRFSPHTIARVMRGMGILLIVIGLGFALRFVRYFAAGH